MTTTTGREPHVSLLNISKRFGGVQALDDVTVRIAAGAVHALVGENGAGKSTLSKVCSGVLSPDAGSVVIDGTPVALRSPRDALLHGIATIAQELALVPHLSVEQNVFLGSEPAVGAFLKPRALRKAFNELVADAGFDLDPAALVGALRTADQQKVEILRALSRGASMIIMDEPTAALSGPDTDRLHAVIKDLARTGHTVVLISHFLSEVLELADTVTILRDGKHVRTAPARDETNASLIEGLLGCACRVGRKQRDRPRHQRRLDRRPGRRDCRTRWTGRRRSHRVGPRADRRRRRDQRRCAAARGKSRDALAAASAAPWRRDDSRVA
jgi:simple sugar transport system ATP-binding protein/ribose transport system ATP-binding protein